MRFAASNFVRHYPSVSKKRKLAVEDMQRTSDRRSHSHPGQYAGHPPLEVLSYTMKKSIAVARLEYSLKQCSRT